MITEMLSLSYLSEIYDRLATNWSPFLLLFILICILYDQLSSWNFKPKGARDTTEGVCVPPPGPAAWPVLGYLPHLGRRPHRKLTALREQYGDVFQIQMGSWPTVILNGIDTVKQAMCKQSEEFAGRPAFYSFKYLAKGKSMGFADYGARWKVHRKIAQNALTSMVNDRENPIELAIQEEAKVLIENLTKQSTEEEINPHNEIYLSVGNIICALCFGKRYQRDDPDFVELIRNNSAFMEWMAAGNPVDILPWMRHFTKSSFNRFLGILDTMDKFCDRKRDEHIATYDSTKVRDITDALLRAVYETPEQEKQKVGLTDEHILITVQELIGAGFDTIATTLQWASLFMATHPEFQKLVQHEIDTVIGKSRMPSVKDLGSLPITEAVMYETMRHSCIFPFALPHSTTKDTFLNSFFIPANTLVFVNLWSVTRDETKFPDPEKFNPYRFLNKTNTELLKDELELFLPFGAGRRRCPGEYMARMELFIFLTALLQRCQFTAIPGVQYSLEAKYGLTLKPEDFKIYVSLRD